MLITCTNFELTKTPGGAFYAEMKFISPVLFLFLLNFKLIRLLGVKRFLFLMIIVMLLRNFLRTSGVNYVSKCSLFYLGQHCSYTFRPIFSSEKVLEQHLGLESKFLSRACAVLRASSDLERGDVVSVVNFWLL